MTRGNRPTQTAPVLLVDDEMQALLSYSTMLKTAGIEEVATLDDSRKVMPFLKDYRVSAVVLDLSMPFINGRELLEVIHTEYPDVPVIIATATNDLDVAIGCMKAGAVDYLVKPIEKNRFISSVQRVLEIGTLRREVSTLKHYLLSDDLQHPQAFAHIVTANKMMHAIFKYIEAIAHSPLPVLITGETGVGKELIARSVHLANPDHGRFVAVNVAGLDDTMFSDTLFGHKKGAFTSAETPREGLILQAEDGTLFLDEIGDLNMPSQVKLLRLIQEKEYYPLGADLPRKTTARVVVTSNVDIKSLIQSSTFRKDLYYRLSAHQIHIPPLRERKEDIPVLLNLFLERAAGSLQKKIPAIPPELVTLLSTYAFPGNVRELEALIYDAVSRHRKGMLSLDSFRSVIDAERRTSEPGETAAFDGTTVPEYLDGFPTLRQAEHYLIDRAMERARGNQGIAASMLGISRQALNKRLNRRKDS